MRYPRWGKGDRPFPSYTVHWAQGGVTAIPAIPSRHHSTAFGVNTGRYATAYGSASRFWNSSLVLSLARPLCRTRNDLPCLLALSDNPSCAILIPRVLHVFHNMNTSSPIWQHLVRLTKIHQVPHLRLQDTVTTRCRDVATPHDLRP